MQKLIPLIVVALSFCAWSVIANEAGALMQDEGLVEEVDFNGPKVQINGYIFTFDLNAKVELGGTRAGAPTLLQPDMKVRIEYLHYADGSKAITRLVELPPSSEISLH